MSLIANGAGEQPTGFYNGVVTTSLRLDKASGAYLYRTPSSAGNTRTYTFSCWLKKIEVFASEVSGQNNALFYAGASGNFYGLNFVGQDRGTANDTINELTIYDYHSDDTTDYGIETNRAFNDPSAWFHLVVATDTTQGTQANRIKFYINGVLQTESTSTQHGAFPQNRETHVNEAVVHWIGRNIDTTSRYYNSYIAEVNFVDGTQYAASEFGETKNGVWIPKEPNVTYGTNGFRLQFKNTGVGTASSSTIGADTSGNNNHWTSGGIAANDCAMPDSPENNFCTWNPISSSALPTLTEGSLKNGGTNSKSCNGTFGVTSGKWYWEERFLTDVSSSGTISFSGVTSFQMENNPDVAPKMVDATGRSVYRNTGNEHDYCNFNQTSRTQTSGGTYWGGAVASFALDMDAGTLKYYTNNSLVHTDSSIPTDGTVIFPFNGAGNSGGSGYNSHIVNFGQDSSFAGNETAQSNTDGNGNGNFFYAVPSGHLALCSANLPEPTIGPTSLTQADDHFNTVLWTGNATNRSITGVGFQPDWVWTKKRSAVQNHCVTDSSRGIGNILFPDVTDAESATQLLTSFDSDGFSINNNALVNENTATYVAWNWKANGGTTTTNDASSTGVGTIDSVIQANATAGFSIVTYTGTGSNGTIAHGLGVAPEMVWVKCRSNSGDWAVYRTDMHAASAANNLRLHDSAAVYSAATMWNSTASTSTVFSVGTNSDSNGSSRTYVAYCFADVDGYSKFGSYTGNGSADGTFVFTGFKPAWVMVKNTARAADWRINDITRQTINKSADTSGGFLLLANSNSAEITNEYDIDFLSNGFKLRSGDVYENGSGETFIYMAFAEAPFKYANAV